MSCSSKIYEELQADSRRGMTDMLVDMKASSFFEDRLELIVIFPKREKSCCYIIAGLYALQRPAQA